MMDMAKRKGIKIDIAALERELGVPVVAVNPRKNKGIVELKKAIGLTAQQVYKVPARDFIDNKSLAETSIENIKHHFPELSDYKAIHYLINHESFDFNASMQETIEDIEIKNKFNPTKTQAEEIMLRYGRIKQVMHQTVVESDPLKKYLFSEKLDNILLHRFWGYVCFFKVFFHLPNIL